MAKKVDNAQVIGEMNEADQAEMLVIAEKLEAAQGEGWAFTRRVMSEMYAPIREAKQPGPLVKRTILIENFLMYLPPVTPAYATFRQYAQRIASLLVSGIAVPGSNDDADALVKAANADLGIGRREKAPKQPKGAKGAQNNAAPENAIDVVLAVLKTEGKGKAKFLAALRKHGYELMPVLEAEKLRGDAKHNAEAPAPRQLRAA